MNIEFTWVSIGVILAILGHAYHTIVWSSKITTQLETVGHNLIRIDKELEKRDIQISASWKKIDSLNDRLTRVETRIETSA